MPANQDNLEEPDPEILQRVVEMIHEMEFSGRSHNAKFQDQVLRGCLG